MNQIRKTNVRHVAARLGAGIAVLLMLAAIVTVWSPPAHAALLPGTPNNPWPAGCSLRLGVSIDRSNSILDDSPFNPGLIRQAVTGLTEGLAGSGMEVGVWSFGTAASGYTGPNPLGPDPSWDITAADYPSIGFTSTDTAVGRQAISDTMDAIPFASESSPQNQRTKGWTNWEAGMGGAASGYVSPGATAPNGDQPADADIVIVVTDGSPTVPGPPELGWTADDPVNFGVTASNAVKQSPAATRVVAIGVGSAVDVDNLERITGGLGTSHADDDYYFIADYDELLSTLLESVANSCGGSAVARKYQLGEQGSTGSWEPAEGRPFDVSFDREPPSVTPADRTGSTDAMGEVGWSWIGDGDAYDVSLSELLLPAERLWTSRCRTQPAGGSPGPWIDLDQTSLTVTVPNAASLECEWFNYVADPRLTVVKEADPARVEEPEGPVTFSLQVANSSPQAIERIRIDGMDDDRFGDLLDADNAAVTENGCPLLSGKVLEPDEIASCSFVAVVAGDVGHPHVNVVTARGTEIKPDGADGLEVVAHDDAEVQFDAPPPPPPSPEPPLPPAPNPPAPMQPTPASIDRKVGSLPVTGVPVRSFVLGGAALITGGAALLLSRGGGIPAFSRLGGTSNRRH